ncbi:unnamed protein product [Lactuca saligna]|uniref:Uncharacterized protein n=1 Tax=Lactuca saligna TaxID=75948 RepID=A0AA35YBR4_LACSI|nr:unnamed protein product [Lactuca saligna]
MSSEENLTEVTSSLIEMKVNAYVYEKESEDVLEEKSKVKMIRLTKVILQRMYQYKAPGRHGHLPKKKRPRKWCKHDQRNNSKKKAVIEQPKVYLTVKGKKLVLKKVKTVEFENCQVSVDSKSIHEILGLPSGDSLLSNMDYISENDEERCMLDWKR